MTASRARVQRAHETETAVARWFRVHGWPFAEPVGAGRDGTDVTGVPGLLVEVKARRDLRPVEWLRQHKQFAISFDNEPKQRPIAHVLVVFRPDGFGIERVGAWGVMMRLDSFTSLLHEAGYGTKEET